MSIFIKLIDDYSIWIYVAAALVALILFRSAIVARRDRVQATFALEREMAHNREIRIFTIAVIILLLMGGVWAVENFVVPNVEIPYEPAPSPSPIFLPTVTETPAPPTTTPTTTADYSTSHSPSH